MCSSRSSISNICSWPVIPWSIDNNWEIVSRLYAHISRNYSHAYAVRCTLIPKWNVGHRCESSSHTHTHTAFLRSLFLSKRNLWLQCQLSTSLLSPIPPPSPPSSESSPAIHSMSIYKCQNCISYHAIIAQHHIALSSLCFTISSGLGPYQMLLSPSFFCPIRALFPWDLLLLLFILYWNSMNEFAAAAQKTFCTTWNLRHKIVSCLEMWHMFSSSDYTSGTLNWIFGSDSGDVEVTEVAAHKYYLGNLFLNLDIAPFHYFIDSCRNYLCCISIWVLDLIWRNEHITNDSKWLLCSYGLVFVPPTCFKETCILFFLIARATLCTKQEWGMGVERGGGGRDTR